MTKACDILVGHVTGNNETKDEWKSFDYSWDSLFLLLLLLQKFVIMHFKKKINQILKDAANKMQAK